MARNRNKDEYEQLRGLVRELQKENKKLKQELRQYIKRENLYENNKDEIKEVLEKKTKESTKKRKCKECGKGDIEEFELMNKIYGTCSVCGDRKRII